MPPLDPPTREGGADIAGAGAGAGGAPNMGGMADMLRNMGMGGGGGAGGGAGGGGMPDLASLMNNPMMMQMAQQMMSNGGLERMMQNPNIANMVRNWIPLSTKMHLTHRGSMTADEPCAERRYA